MVIKGCLYLKVLAGFQWITYDLGDVSEFFITTDDDCVINMPTVFDYFFTHREASKNKLHCGYIYDQGSYPIRLDEEQRFPTFLYQWTGKRMIANRQQKSLLA